MEIQPVGAKDRRRDDRQWGQATPLPQAFSGLCRPRGSRSLFLPISITAAGLFMELIGTWHLVEWIAGDEHPRGGDAVGRLLYSGDGFMAAFLARADGFTDALAYSGTWELRGREEVVHHVSVSTRRSFVGADLVRTVSWEGDDLVLTTPPRDGVANVLRWQRAAG